MSVRDATVHSVNAVFAQLDLDVGPEEVRETAYDMGITTHLDAFPAEGIGGLRIGVTPLEMANAYATLANGGIRNTATAISKVEFPNGDTDVPEEEERTRAFSDGVAYEVTDVLKGVIISGTAARRRASAARARPARPALPTTTPTPGSSATRRGSRPRSGSGYADARTSMGSGAYGGTFAAPIWHDYMLAAQGTDCPDFPRAREPGRVLDLERLAYRLGSRAPRPPTAAPRSPSSPPAGGTAPASGNGKYPSDLYAPGAGPGPRAQPAPGRRRTTPRRLRRRRGDRRRGRALRLELAEGGGRAGARDARRRRDPARCPRGRAGAGDGRRLPRLAARRLRRRPRDRRRRLPDRALDRLRRLPRRGRLRGRPRSRASCAGRSSAARWRSRWRHRFCRWTCSATSPTLGWGRCTGSTPTTSPRPRSRTISPPLGWRTIGRRRASTALCSRSRPTRWG